MFDISVSQKSLRIRLIVWTVMCLLLILALLKILWQGFSINTNILDLLPKAQQTATVTLASEQFTTTIGKQLVFLVGNANKQQAQQAASLFYQQIESSGLLNKVAYKINRSEQQAWASFYYPYRLSLLSNSDKQLLLNQNVEKLTSQAMLQLYNPLSISNSDLLENDPWFFFQHYVTALPKPASQLTVVDQQLMTQSNGRWYVMITAETKENSFSMTTQRQISELIAKTKASMQHAIPNTQLLMTGVLFYAEAGAKTAQHDISTIGVGSLLGIILLVLFSFRSIKPLFLTLFSGGVGFLAAFVVTQWLFPHIYLFTLVFGVSLIGISVDYAFFYYADQVNGGKSWKATQGLTHIFPGVSLGLTNVVLAYLVIALTPFPGLKQLAVFSISGLLMAYATVVCVFPYVLKAQKVSFTPLLQRLSNAYLQLWQALSVKKIIVIYVLLAIVSLLGVLLLTANDDIRILEATPVPLKQQEQHIKKIIGSDIGANFYVVTGATPQQTLSNEHQLTAKLHAQFSDIAVPFIALGAYLPTVANQQQNYQLIEQSFQGKTLVNYLKKIGVAVNKANAIQKTLANITFTPLTITDWLASPVSKSLRYLWLGNVNGKYASIVLLSNQLTPSQLQTVAAQLPNVNYINKANEVSTVFKNYRQKISVLLCCAYLALFAILTLRYGMKKALIYVLPPITAACLSLAVLGLLGIPLTLFNLLALILVLGIAIDYILFFAETRSNYRSTMLAVSLSAITMALSFGLLALSATPVIHYFGVTILVGILTAYLLSPLAIRVSVNNKEVL